MRVKATKKGFDGTCIREPGDIFDMPEGTKGSWFEPEKKDEPVKDEDTKATNKKAAKDLV